MGKKLSAAIVLAAGLLVMSGVAFGQQDVQKKLDKQQQQLDAQQQLIETLQKKLSELEKSSREATLTKDEFDKLKKEIEAAVDKLVKQYGPLDFRVFWKEGLRLESGNGQFKMKIGGRIMNDWAWMRAERDVRKAVVAGTPIGVLEDGTEFRRVRLYVAGTMYGNIDFKLQFDFAGGTAVLKDAYIGIKGLPVGYLKIGHFNEPFSMNLLISSKYITFMERASPTDGVFAPGRNTGVQLSNTCFGERVTWAIGVFRDTGSTGMDTTDGGHAVTGRVTALPIYRDKGRKLLHVGLAGSYRDTNKTTTYAARPEMHLAPKFMSTGAISPSSVSLLGGEVAAVYGPWSAQAEVIWSSASGVGSSGNFYGYYGQLSYFLTGEHRPYKKSTGLFSRVKPKKNFGKDGGRGAWEVAGRYSFLDLSDAGIAGGQLRDFTLGLNWYLNPNTRIMWNYVHAELLGIGYADLAGMRVQIDF